MNTTTSQTNTAEATANSTTRHLTCIICPMGCQLEVTVPEDYTEENKRTIDPTKFTVSGNTCPRGDAYARKELTTPERTLTCTVAVTGGKRPLVSAKTAGEVPKELLLDCMQVIRRLTIKAPVHAGDVLVYDLLHTGVNLVAGETVER